MFTFSENSPLTSHLEVEVTEIRTQVFSRYTDGISRFNLQLSHSQTLVSMSPSWLPAHPAG